MDNANQTTLPDFTTYYDVSLGGFALAAIVVVAVSAVIVFALLSRRKS